MSAVLAANRWLDPVPCASCGTVFAIEQELRQQRVKDGGDFYCPNGHVNVYRETEADGLRKELERSRAAILRAESETARERKSREWAESRAKGANIAAGKAKAATRRLHARIHAGVCPDCHRTFKQLAAHMKSKHGPK